MTTTKNGRNLIEDEPRSSISAARRRPAIESCGTIIEMRKYAHCETVIEIQRDLDPVFSPLI